MPSDRAYVPARFTRRTPGATSFSPSTSVKFFQVGNTVLMRWPSALRPSGSFSTRPGSVHHLYSAALTTISASGKTGLLVPFSIKPEDVVGMEMRDQDRADLRRVDTGRLHAVEDTLRGRLPLARPNRHRP